MENNKFITEIYSIQELENKRFIIPPYQRPYVWGDEHINKLLSDFHDAYENRETNDEYYYIGTVLLNKPENDKEVYQLIDGQQRFTTLWLIAVAFKMLEKETKSDIKNFLKVDDELRIDFAIRKQIKSYLLALMEKQVNEKNQYSDSEIENDEYLVNIANAITIIISKIKIFEFKEGKSLCDFGNFIFQKVYFVVNTVPQRTDLNKLFTTINNSGIQLEQHDILKSLLLKRIATEKTVYSRIWEACENMNNYFESNVKQLFPNEFDWDNINFDDLQNCNLSNHETIVANITSDSSYMISDILSDKVIVGEDEQKLNTVYPDEKNDNNVYCRSILTFPQLLLHTYRIFLKEEGDSDFDLPFHSNNLLRIFKSLSDTTDESKIKTFFKTLWKVRFVFDKCVVKWRQIDDGKKEELLLTTLDFSRTNETRPSEVSMLQCMLHCTGNYNTQIWLTPYLKRLLDGEDSLLCLESIDNNLSLSQNPDKETTFALMDKDFVNDNIFDYKNYLGINLGTFFRHYWFQKLEYVLWKEFSKDENVKNSSKFKNYRITSKNSVEHVFPQNQEYGEKIPADVLNSFGNLALLSVNQNSSYSNQTIVKKKDDFDRKDTYDSLKLKCVYESDNVKDWGEQEIIKHRDEMIEKLKNHYII
jgi:uncharacterized protein with ParB-like and HNH nuclease domain